MRGDIQCFRQLIEVPPDRQQLLIRTGQTFQLRLAELGVSDESSSDQGHDPPGDRKSFGSCQRLQETVLGLSKVNLDPHPGFFSSIPDLGSPWARQGEIPMHDLGEDLPEDIARRHLLLGAPGQPSLLEWAQVRTNRVQSFAHTRSFPALDPHPRESPSR